MQTAPEPAPAAIGTIAPDVEALHRQAVDAAQHGMFDVAIAGFREVAALDPGYRDVRYNLVGMATLRSRGLMDRGLLVQATARFLDVLDDIGAERRVRVLASHFLISLSARWRDQSLRNFLDLAHRAASLLPDDPTIRTYLENALVGTGAPGELRDYTTGIGPDDLGTHVLIACFPKSASTFLKNLLVALTGFKSANLAYAYFQNEQEIYLPYLLDIATDDTVVQQHCRASDPNLHILQGFAVRPVVLVRNIFDVLLSWKEFLDQGAYVNTFHANWRDLPEEARLDAVIADRAPWYFSFFAGWQAALAAKRLDGLWLTYERLTADPAAALSGIAAFHEIEKSPAEIAQAIGTVTGGGMQNRLNQGVAGRGIEAFSADQTSRIRALADSYAGTDFTLIGL